MTTGDCLIALFYPIDQQRHAMPTPPEAPLWPSEVGPLGRRQALQGVGHRPCERWWTRAYRALVPRLAERTRLLRLLKPQQDWPQVCWASPTVLGVLDPYGIELLHPIRAGRSPQQIGRKGRSNPRWMVGGTLCLL
jgi:hypothetical protein